MNGKGYSRRKRDIREELKKFFIICEGECDEPRYFKGFDSRYNRLEILPLHSGGTDPKSIVEYAIKIKKSNDFNKGDIIWCAFDVNNNTNTQIQNAKNQADVHQIDVALTNPCFELWLLLHFKDVTACIIKNDAKSELRGYIRNYKKLDDLKERLDPDIDTASRRADRQIHQCHINGYDLYSLESNPSTRIHVLLRQIQDITDQNIAEREKNVSSR